MRGVEKVLVYNSLRLFAFAFSPLFCLLSLSFSSNLSILLFINVFPFLMKQPPEMEISEGNQIRYACHVVRLLLPWLRKLRQEQMEEKKLEAKIKGIVFLCCMTIW